MAFIEHVYYIIGYDELSMKSFLKGHNMHHNGHTGKRFSS